MAISRVDLKSLITELVTRNPTMGIPALEDRLFVNLLIFDYLRSSFELRLRCVLHASEVRLRCVWNVFEARDILIHDSFTTLINLVRALSLQGPPYMTLPKTCKTGCFN